MGGSAGRLLHCNVYFSGRFSLVEGLFQQGGSLQGNKRTLNRRGVQMRCNIVLIRKNKFD